MPVLTRRRATRTLIAAAATVPLLLAGGAAVISVLIGQSCSGGAGVADSASQVAHRNIPANFLAIYESVGARYRIPWEVLARVGEEECDHGRNPDRSCTPQPGAIGPQGSRIALVRPGRCRSASAVVRAAQPATSTTRCARSPDPSLGAHDPMTAVSLAALVLIKDKAVPTAPDPHGTFIATSALPAPDSLSRCRPAWRWAAQCLSHGIL